MKKYSGFEYLLIDAANQFGNDKMLFEQRIQWALDNFSNLEALESGEKTQPQFRKAVMAIRAAQRGEDIGHMVGLDACCSGMQIMSALTGCLSGCKATNLVNTGVRQDAYTLVTDAASMELGGGLNLLRSAIKTAVMTHLYGSKAEPRNLFGEDTPELAAFYVGVEEVCPLANELLGDLIHTWQPYAEVHEWVLPDNFHARVKVTELVECRVEIDEMDHATFEHAYNVVCGKEHDVKNAANVIHSIDAYVLRCMQRRCKYDYIITAAAHEYLTVELDFRGPESEALVSHGNDIDVYVDLYNRTNMADAVILPYINSHSVELLSTDHIEALIALCNSMLAHAPFELVTVHDEFKCHPNYCNDMRQHYINIFAEMADSNLLDDVVHQITGSHVSYAGTFHGISQLIRESEYALS